MTAAIVACALAVAALNAIPGALGGRLWYRGTPSASRARDGLFYLYALLPLAVAFIAEQLRLTAAQTVLDQRGLAGAKAVGELSEREQRRLVAQIVRREIGVMAASALVVVFLALRAAST